MKVLLLTVVLLVVGSGCLNPLDFGSTKMVHLESDQMTKDFECNDKIVSDWSEWFKWSEKDGVFCIGKMGVKVFERSNKMVIRFTHYYPNNPPNQDEAVYNKNSKSKIFEVVQDSILFTNLKVWY